MHDRTFVGSDDVGAVFERRSDVVDPRLTIFDIEGSGFE